jgi:hypothetical protein
MNETVIELQENSQYIKEFGTTKTAEFSAVRTGHLYCQ